MEPLREEPRREEPRREEPRRKHKVLAFFVPFLSGLVGLIASLYCGLYVMDDLVTFKDYLKSNLAEFCIIVIALFLTLLWMPKLFPKMKDYSFGKPDWCLLLAIFLISPLYMILKYKLIGLIANAGNTVPLKEIIYDSDMLKEDLMASISAIIFAPIYEEIFYRVIPLSIYDKTIKRIFSLIFITGVFALLHGRNWIAVILDALIYGFLFLYFKNAWTNICAHACNNLAATILAVLSFYGATVFESEEGPLFLIVPQSWLWYCIGFAATGIVVLILSKKKGSK